MDQLFVVDIDRYIMYLDQAPHMWPEVEGREDLMNAEVNSKQKDNLKRSDENKGKVVQAQGTFSMVRRIKEHMEKRVASLLLFLLLFMQFQMVM